MKLLKAITSPQAQRSMLRTAPLPPGSPFLTNFQPTGTVSKHRTSQQYTNHVNVCGVTAPEPHLSPQKRWGHTSPCKQTPRELRGGEEKIRRYLVERWELQPELHLGHFKPAFSLLSAEQEAGEAARRDFSVYNGERSSFMTATAAPARESAQQAF